MYQSFGFSAFLPVLLLPRLEEAWMLSEAEKAAVTSSFFVGQFIGQISTGFFSDRFGRRWCARMLMPASFALGLAHFLCSDVHQLAIVHGIAGVVSGGMVVATVVLVNELMPQDRRALAASLGFAVGWVGGVLLFVLVAAVCSC